MNVKEICYEGVHWIQLAQDGVSWQAPEKKVKKERNENGSKKRNQVLKKNGKKSKI
jgi:hypothetical protein